MKIINSDRMPSGGGHYSTCVEHNGLLYISGQLPKHPNDGSIPAGIVDQTHQVLKNLELILQEAGSSFNQVLQMRIYIPDVSYWGQVNEIYATYFTDHKPARCVVPTRELHYGSLIEAECIAFV